MDNMNQPIVSNNVHFQKILAEYGKENVRVDIFPLPSGATESKVVQYRTDGYELHSLIDSTDDGVSPIIRFAVWTMKGGK